MAGILKEGPIRKMLKERKILRAGLEGSSEKIPTVEELMRIGWTRGQAITIAREITETPFLVVSFDTAIHPIDWNATRTLDEAKDWRKRMLSKPGTVAADIYELTLRPVL